MMSTAKPGRIVMQPVDDACKCMPRFFDALVQQLCVKDIVGFVDLWICFCWESRQVYM